MAAACKCTGPIWKEPQTGRTTGQEASHHILQTKETKEGRTLYYAAVLVSVTLILHSTQSPSFLIEHFLLWPRPPEAYSTIKQPTTMPDYWNLVQTLVTIHVLPTAVPLCDDTP